VTRWTTDPEGRDVVLDANTIEHFKRRRPGMLEHLDAILGAISRPDHRDDDPRLGRERFYRQGLNPDRWLRVVVDFNVEPAFVVTAFVQHNDPRSEVK
jgi:hypothetical protein